ncbi:glycosyltransferase family 2 protein [Phenylobacterium zucineum]|uniref:glycosyltransferase family 2 protein n=1 Tax=Phenylobacterium zucineum TaxID=284016 RepID=UPI00059BA562|nr:glycosyltransferase family 2 protein [Phenylobacterium zucineum]
MHVAVVIPCLNEEAGVRATAMSLAGETDRLPSATDLILVDNGSTDATWDVLGDLVARGEGRIHRVRERERGFVPPRHRGVLHAARLARRRGLSAGDVLILQGDADTNYLPGYVERMRAAAGANVLLEGSIGRTNAGDSRLAAFRALELKVDQVLRPYEVEDAHETLVDDKACGYRLVDYQRWGGLQREYAADGSELHAETTRLFLRARAMTGAARRRVESAGALTSPRRILEDPALYFCTAGYPRERGWIARFRQAVAADHGPSVRLGAAVSHANRAAIRYRIGHTLVLFWVLPRLAARLLDDPAGAQANSVDLGLQDFSRGDFAERPGWVLTRLLEMIEPADTPLGRLLDRHADEAVCALG